MTETCTIRDLHEKEGRDVRLRGWLCGRRSGGKVLFLLLRDGTGTCQCVVEAGDESAFEAGVNLPLESSLAVEGRARVDKRAEGGCEVAVSKIEVIGKAGEYPITRKAHGVDFLLDHRHLWLRSKRPHAILRIRHTLIKACRDFFDSRGFTLVDTPILVAGAGEDSASLFPVEYFDRKAFLAQTGQLYLESACAALGRVYCFGPTFRAETSKTRRHLTEFWMIEPEVAFAELDDIVSLAEDMVCEIVQSVLARHEEDLKSLGRDVEPLRRVRKPFARISYDEAVSLLRSPATREKLEAELAADRRRLQACVDDLGALEKQEASAVKPWQKDRLAGQIHQLRETIRDLEQSLANRPHHIELAANFEWGGDLGGSDETIVSRHFETPVFVTDYPCGAKAFYMKRRSADSRTVRNMDLLAPEGYGEIIGGSQREDDLAMLEDAMRRKKLKPSDYEWYLDLRRYGAVPHGGFGMGIERALAWICGLEHVRETIPFPRTVGRLYP